MSGVVGSAVSSWVNYNVGSYNFSIPQEVPLAVESFFNSTLYGKVSNVTCAVFDGIAGGAVANSSHLSSCASGALFAYGLNSLVQPKGSEIRVLGSFALCAIAAAYSYKTQPEDLITHGLEFLGCALLGAFFRVKCLENQNYELKLQLEAAKKAAAQPASKVATRPASAPAAQPTAAQTQTQNTQNPPTQPNQPPITTPTGSNCIIF